MRKRQRGTTVHYWQFVEAKAATGPDEDDKGKKVPVLRSYTVFDSEQVTWPEGSKHGLVEATTESDGAASADDNYTQVEQVISATGAAIEHQGARAFYSPAEDRIVVPTKTRFESTSAY